MTHKVFYAIVIKLMTYFKDTIVFNTYLFNIQGFRRKVNEGIWESVTSFLTAFETRDPASPTVFATLQTVNRLRLSIPDSLVK
jgi:hypothetical protein